MKAGGVAFAEARRCHNGLSWRQALSSMVPPTDGRDACTPSPWIKGAWCSYLPPREIKRNGAVALLLTPSKICFFQPKVHFFMQMSYERKNDMLFSNKNNEPTHQGSLDKSSSFENITKWGYRKATDKRRPPACSIFRALNHGTILLTDLRKNIVFSVPKTLFWKI